jgi:hypothetical protein
VALFMVVASMTLLAVLVTEFTYVAQVNSRMAFDSLDQVKAHALAKSGLKISLLRLKAYQTLKGFSGTSEGGSSGGPDLGSMIPKGILEKIWSFPFFYPIPTEVPGLTPGEREKIREFTKKSGFEGSFSALIESESSKYNLNSLLAPFAITPNPSPYTPSNSPASPASPAGTPGFNAEAAHKSLADFLTQILSNKMESDEVFASEYRDFRLDELVDNLIQWVDPNYQRRSAPPRDFRPKGGPFYSLTELRMIPPMDDGLYDLLAPQLTVSSTPGINVNTIKNLTLRALMPGMTIEEVKEFFKFRDSPNADNSFKSADDFFNYLKANVAVFRGSDAEIQKFKESLSQRNLQIITDESQFKITIQARVNQATRLLEAWVTLKSTGSGSTPPQPPRQATEETQPMGAPDTGLRITSMRFL